MYKIGSLGIDIEVRTALATQYATNFAAARSADLLRETTTLFLAEAPGGENVAENSPAVAFEKNFTARRERSQEKESDKESRLGEHLEYCRIYSGESESCFQGHAKARKRNTDRRL